jgi:energy-coupling factor transporter ATP-binding protein EcfA2
MSGLRTTVSSRRLPNRGACDRRVCALFIYCRLRGRQAAPRAHDKNFGGTHAHRCISMAVHGGEVHAIFRENGAGKSALIKILSGAYPVGSFRGRFRLNGHDLAVRSIFLKPSKSAYSLCRRICKRFRKLVLRGWTRSFVSPTGFRFCATARWSTARDSRIREPQSGASRAMVGRDIEPVTRTEASIGGLKVDLRSLSLAGGGARPHGSTRSVSRCGAARWLGCSLPSGADVTKCQQLLDIETRGQSGVIAIDGEPIGITSRPTRSSLASATYLATV